MIEAATIESEENRFDADFFDEKNVFKKRFYHRRRRATISLIRIIMICKHSDVEKNKYKHGEREKQETITHA